MIGDTIECAGVAIFFAVDRANGRRPTPRERSSVRDPYRARYGRREPQPVDDDALAEQAAIELARIEQERRPVDLISA